jgi:large conductance mechanosensitive channel
MLKEFKEFAVKGNVLELAIAVIMGTAFGAVINSIVNDIIMPPVGMARGAVDFKDLFISLRGQSYPSLAMAKAAGAPVIAYGQFLNTVLNFLIVAWVMFLIIHELVRPKPAEAPATKECPYCISNVPARAVRCAHCTSELR